MKSLHTAVASLVIGGLLVSASAQMNSPPSAPLGSSPPAQAPRQGADKPLLPAPAADSVTAGAVRETLAQTVNDALTENGFPNLLRHLAKADRDRIGAMEGEKFDDLNKAIARLREDFHAKYHQEFDLQTQQLKDMTVTFGLDKKAVTASLNEPEAKPASPASSLPSAIPSPGEKATDIAASTGLNVVNGPMVNLLLEGRTVDGVLDSSLWKIDIPNEITGRQLKENLTRHLIKLDDQKSTWPDDVNAAYHAAASEVFQAFNDSTLASER